MKLKAILAILSSRSFVVVSDAGVHGRYKSLMVPGIINGLKHVTQQLVASMELEHKPKEGK